MKTSLFVSLAAALCPLVAQAKPVYLHMLTTQYPDSRLSHACQTCHEVGRAMGPYGKDFVRIKNELGIGNMGDVWRLLNKMDSDGDGKSNDQELNKDRDPNDPEN